MLALFAPGCKKYNVDKDVFPPGLTLENKNVYRYAVLTDDGFVCKEPMDRVRCPDILLIYVINKCSQPYNFKIENTEFVIDDVAPGASRPISAYLETGDYVLSSSHPNGKVIKFHLVRVPLEQ